MDIKKRLVYNSVMSRIKNLFIPLALFLLSFFIRLAFISKGPFHYDALELAIAAQKTLETFKLHYLHIPGSPLTVILAAINLAVFKLFSINDPVYVVNFLAVYFSSLCVVLLYFVAKELFDELTGVFAALFLMVLPPFLSVSLYGKDHAPALFFALLSVLLLLKYFARGSRVFLITCGLAVGLCGSVRLADVLIFFPILLWLIIYPLKEKKDFFNIKNYNFKNFAIFILSCIIPILIFYLPLVNMMGIKNILARADSVYYAEFIGVFSRMLPVSIAYAYVILSPWGAILSLIGLYIIFLKRKKLFLFLASWFLILFFYYGNVINGETVRYLIIALVPLIIALGVFFCELSRRHKLFGALAMVVFFTILLHLFIKLLPTLEFRHRYNLQENFAHWVAENTEENAVIMAMDENIFIDYYTGRKTLGIPEVPITCDDRIIRKFLREYVDRYLKSNIPLYITTNNLAYDPCRRLADLLQQNYAIKFKGCRTNEAWYRSSMELLLFRDCLFGIEKKKP